MTFDATMRRTVEARLAEMNPSERRFVRGDFRVERHDAAA